MPLVGQIRKTNISGEFPANNVHVARGRSSRLGILGGDGCRSRGRGLLAVHRIHLLDEIRSGGGRRRRGLTRRGRRGRAVGCCGHVSGCRHVAARCICGASCVKAAITTSRRLHAVTGAPPGVEGWKRCSVAQWLARVLDRERAPYPWWTVDRECVDDVVKERLLQDGAQGQHKLQGSMGVTC